MAQAKNRMHTEKEVKDWYDRFYSEKGEKSRRPYEAYPVFLDYLKAENGKKLLDVSCGTSWLLLAAARRGLETYGVDISSQAVKIAKKITPESKIALGQAEELKYDDKIFDYITCLGSLEHFIDKDKALQEMKRVAKDDARFCIMLPNSRFILWKISINKGTEQQDINETLMTDKQWRGLFTGNGLEVTNVYQDKWFSRKLKIFESVNPASIIKKAFLKTAWAMLPFNMTYQFIYILKKAGTS